MFKVIFNELNPEYGLLMQIGEKSFRNEQLEAVHSKAKNYVEILKDLRNTDVSYMVEQNGQILVTINLN